MASIATFVYQNQSVFMAPRFQLTGWHHRMSQLHLDIADGTQPKHFPRFRWFSWFRKARCFRVTQSAGSDETIMKHIITYLKPPTQPCFLCVWRRVFKARLMETIQIYTGSNRKSTFKRRSLKSLWIVGREPQENKEIHIQWVCSISISTWFQLTACQ